MVVECINQANNQATVFRYLVEVFSSLLAWLEHCVSELGDVGNIPKLQQHLLLYVSVMRNTSNRGTVQ